MSCQSTNLQDRRPFSFAESFLYSWGLQIRALVRSRLGSARRDWQNDRGKVTLWMAVWCGVWMTGFVTGLDMVKCDWQACVCLRTQLFFSSPLVTLYICQRHARLSNEMGTRQRDSARVRASDVCARVFVYAHVIFARACACTSNRVTVRWVPLSGAHRRCRPFAMTPAAISGLG